MSEEKPVVFVIDDDPSICAALSRLFRAVALNVQTFGSTQEFLQTERPDAPGCIVLDVKLPGLNGLDFQSELAKSKNSSSNYFYHWLWRHSHVGAGNEGRRY